MKKEVADLLKDISNTEFERIVNVNTDFIIIKDDRHRKYYKLKKITELFVLISFLVFIGTLFTVQSNDFVNFKSGIVKHLTK